MSDKKYGRGFSGKGYYIALILCAAAIGISGYVYYQNAGEPISQEMDTPVLASEEADISAAVPKTTPGADAATGPSSEAAQPTAGKMEVCAPVEGEILADYAMEVLSYNQTTRDWRVHNGVDIAAAAGTPVVAAADGQVYTVYDDEQMGMTVVIRHEDGYTTRYSSLSQAVSVSAGDTVAMGQAIGTVGSTALMENALGDHVHFSVTHNDEPVDPVDFMG